MWLGVGGVLSVSARACSDAEVAPNNELGVSWCLVSFSLGWVVIPMSMSLSIRRDVIYGVA